MSHIPEDQSLFQSLFQNSTAIPKWIAEVQDNLTGDSAAQALVLQLLLAPSTSTDHYTYRDGFLRYKGRLYIGSYKDFRAKILTEVHSSPNSGHGGIQATFKQAEKFFYWSTLQRDVLNFVVRSCDTCQRHKAEHASSPRLLQPLPGQEVPG